MAFIFLSILTRSSENSKPKIIKFITSFIFHFRFTSLNSLESLFKVWYAKSAKSTQQKD